MNEKGITLTELLVAMTIAVIAAAVGYVFFTSTFNFSILHGRTAEMQRESRTAMDILSREIRNAGFGVIEPLTGAVQGTVSPIQVGNNVDPEPGGAANRLDRITVIGGYQSVGTLSAAAATGATQITVTFLTGVNPADLVGKTITIEGFYQGTVISRVGVTTTFNVSPALERSYSAQNSVAIVQRIRYRVAIPAGGVEPALFREVDVNNNGAFNDAIDQSDTIASGIEDLQFAYLLNTGAESQSPAVAAPPAAPTIRAVRISLVARGRDPKSSATAISTRPAVEDHAAGAAADRYHRRLVTKVAEVRNLGFF